MNSSWVRSTIILDIQAENLNSERSRRRSNVEDRRIGDVPHHRSCYLWDHMGEAPVLLLACLREPRPERVRRGGGSAREPRGQGRAARGTEVSLGPPMTRSSGPELMAAIVARVGQDVLGWVLQLVLAECLQIASNVPASEPYDRDRRSAARCPAVHLSSGPTRAINSERSSISSSARTARRGEQAQKKAEQRDHRR